MGAPQADARDIPELENSSADQAAFRSSAPGSRIAPYLAHYCGRGAVTPAGEEAGVIERAGMRVVAGRIVVLLGALGALSGSAWAQARQHRREAGVVWSSKFFSSS